MGRFVFWKILLLNTIVIASAQQDRDRDHHDSSEQLSIRPTSQSSSPHTSNNIPTLIPLKHRRYKSYRSNTTSSSSSSRASSSSPTTTHHVHVIPDEELLLHDDDHFLHHSHKSPRSGLQLQKAPPDLQFGLAFTVPFVSLSTEKLLHTVSGKNFDSVSSLLKLNFSGLILAAVVGIVAVAGLFLPSILSHGGLGGWANPWLDGLAPHFTGEQYNDYGNGWDNKGGWLNGNKGEFLGRNGRGLENVVFGVLGKVRRNVEECVVERVCEDKKRGAETKIMELVNEVTTNELVRDIGVVKMLKGIVDGDYSKCSSGKKNPNCKGINGVEEIFTDLVSNWGDSTTTEKKQ